MAVQITRKEKLMSDVEKLKEIALLPNLYLANYFMDLRNDVDKELLPQQLNLENNQEKKQEINELWKQIIEKIDSFEKQSKRKKINLEEYQKRISEIEKVLNENSDFNLDEVETVIENEELKLLENLFQNKTIVWTNGKLVLLNSDFISRKSLVKR
jgi:ABC-type branched-subunit amino acid transport system ATPase component